jgi:hypothetical protein
VVNGSSYGGAELRDLELGLVEAALDSEELDFLVLGMHFGGDICKIWC